MKILSLREYHKRGTHRSEIGWSVPFCDSALGDFVRFGMSPTSPAFLFRMLKCLLVHMSTSWACRLRSLLCLMLIVARLCLEIWTLLCRRVFTMYSAHSLATKEEILAGFVRLFCHLYARSKWYRSICFQCDGQNISHTYRSAHDCSLVAVCV